MNSKNSLLRTIATWRGSQLLLSLIVLSVGRVDAAQVDVRRDGVVIAVEKVMPTVVNIGTATLIRVEDPFEEWFLRHFDPYRGRQRAAHSLGSGVIIDESGYILTNDHVVRRADKITVTLNNTNVYEARLVAGSSSSDVALIKIEPRRGEVLRAATFAQDDDIMLGETVLALGNPFGLGGSVSRGILSSKNRRLPASKGPLEIEDWLQTDAAINPGNSGGPLINLRGEIIGLNVAVFREGNAEGIGFAIPIRRVSEALSEIFTPEGTRHLWFGARVKATPRGLQIVNVESGSPAEKAGLKGGDIVARVGERTPKNFVEFIVELLDKGETDQDVAMVVTRGGAHRQVAVRLVAEKTIFNAELIRRRTGLTLQELTGELATALRLNIEGLLVAGVDANSPASAAGLQRGFVITSIRDQPVSDIIQAAKFIRSGRKGEVVSLGVLAETRRGLSQTLRQVAVELKLR